MKALFTFVALLLSTATFAQLKTESEILALSKKRIQYLLENKIDSLAMIYDENSLTIHSNGMIKTTAEHIDDVKNGRPVYKSIEISEATVKDFGTIAILVGKGIFKIAMNGQDMSYKMAYTEVYLNKNKKWKLISRQSTTY